MDAATAEETRRLLDEARIAIGTYCMSRCGAKCCRRGRLNMTADQADAVTMGRRTELEEKKALVKEWDGSFSLDLAHGCVCLDDELRCARYPDGRPRVCHDYPLFLFDDRLLAAPDCPAVEEGLFAELLEKLRKKGIRPI